MRSTRRKTTKEISLGSKILIILALLFVSIPVTLYLSQNEQRLNQNAQTPQPSFFCLAAPCPGSAASPSPNENPAISSMPAPTSISLPPVSTVPGNNPCQNDDAAIATDNDHKKPRGGFFEQLLEFLMKIIEKIIALFGGSPKSAVPAPSQGDDPVTQAPEAPQEEPEKPTETPKQEEPTQQPETPCEPQASTAPQEQPEPSDVPATTDTCGGKYNLTNPRKQNFGDPQCNFDKNALYTQLKQIDAANADIWFNEVVPCESSYNPNAYASPAIGTPDAGGAWGLFQMGQGKNGEFDHGDVVWGSQASNAVNYNNTKIGGNWRYWACAKSHWK